MTGFARMFKALLGVWPSTSLAARPPTRSMSLAEVETGLAAGFRIERRRIALADLAPDDLRGLIGELNELADDVGCAVLYDGKPFDRVAIIFAGNLERFYMLAVARHLSCPVIFVQDVKSWWFQGSDLVPDLESFCEGCLKPWIGSADVVCFGQSSGGYAALVASAFFPGATVMACSPQTFSDAQVKGRVSFVGIRALSTPDGLIDVKEILSGRCDPMAFRAVVIAGGELDNPASKHYWMDYLHACRLLELESVHLSVLPCNYHSIVHGKVNQFAILLETLAAQTKLDPDIRRATVNAFLSETFSSNDSAPAS